MSLRNVRPDGSVAELKLVGTEVLDGRDTERWQKTMTDADGKKDVSTQWYDPELRIITREELHGGYFRELKSIEIAPQPPALFTAPADYKQVETSTSGKQ